jgi:hypothetical protein
VTSPRSEVASVGLLAIGISSVVAASPLWASLSGSGWLIAFGAATIAVAPLPAALTG